MAAKAKNKHPDVKDGGAGGALLERNTGSWHPRGRELSYGTEAQVWGTGKILIYKIDVWQISISTLTPQSHFRYLQRLGVVDKKFTAYKIRKKEIIICDWFQILKEAAENSFAHS